MDWTRVLTTSISMLVTGALIAWFMRAAARPPAVEGEAIQLRYPKSMRVFMAIAGSLFAAASLGIAIAVALGEGDDKLFRISWICVPLFGAMGFGALFELRVNLLADGEGIRGQTAFRGFREVRWDELVIVYYSGGLNTFKLVDRNGACLCMSRYLVGHELIVELMRQQLPKRVVGKAIDNYRNAVKAGF